MYIVITRPEFFEGEASRINQMFMAGMPRLHLRKPGSTSDECRQLLQQIPACYHERIVLHDHFSLAEEFNVGGVHLNSRNPSLPEALCKKRTGEVPSSCAFPRFSVSCSCHSLEEVKARKDECDYVTLSPIYDSISKQGYRSAFTVEELKQAASEGVIDSRVYALGGVTYDRVPDVEALGFAGGMVLGDAWQTDSATPPVVLSVAGSDSSAGAGIQQDLKTMTACGCYGATVITAITSQNTQGVQAVDAVSAETVRSQMLSVFSDLRVSAVKLGMIPNKDVAEAIVEVLAEQRQKRPLPIVCDPVMISTSGTRLMTEDCISYITKHLFPLCTLLTPNIPEHQYLCERLGDIMPSVSLLLKGGHADGEEMTDELVVQPTGERLSYSSPRIKTTNLHGTGCTLSSAIASFIAHGMSLPQAVEKAKEMIDRYIRGGASIRIGHGNGPLWLREK